MDYSKIKLAVVGFGRMGITHFSILNTHPDIEIKAVADTSTLILKLLEKYVKDVHTYSDYNELFKNEKLDAAIVCTPPAMHYPVALKAAENGVHVFSEKPFTAESQKAKELAQLFHQKKLVNQVGYVNRFNDIFRTVKEYIDQKLIGDIIRFKSEMYSKTITKTHNGNTWRDSHENGGGAIYEMASHAIDLVNFLIGKPDKVSGSYFTHIYSKNVEDAVIANFLYKNGISGTLNVNWSDESYRKPTNTIEIFGTKGKLLADQYSTKIFMKKADPKFKLNEGWNSIYITDVFKPVPFYLRGIEFTAQLFHFIDCIKKKEEYCKCSFSDAVYTHDVIDAMFKDFELNGKISS